MATLNILTPTDFANGIPEKWNQVLFYDAIQESVTGKFEGSEGEDNFIVRQDDFTKSAGDTLHFQTLAQLWGAGRTYAQTLTGYEEKPDLGQFDLTLTSIRHAVAARHDTNTQSLYKPAEKARPLLSNWFGRYLDIKATTQLVTTATSQTTIYAGDATSVASLADTSGNEWTLTVEDLKRGFASLMSMGAKPLKVSQKNGIALPTYGALISDFDRWHLRSDVKFDSLNELVLLRGEENPLITGAISMIDGMMVYIMPSIRGHGSPLRPEAEVYGSHTAAVTTITVGEDTTGVIDYTRDFASSGTLSIQNTSGAIEYVTYTAKTTYSFTGCTRGDSYNSITSSAVAYTGSAKEWVTQGHSQSTVIFFGANALLRGYGEYVNEVKQTYDYENEIGIGIRAVLGHKEVCDSAGNARNYIIQKCCSKSFDEA